MHIVLVYRYYNDGIVYYNLTFLYEKTSNDRFGFNGRTGKEGHKAEMEISQDELTLDFILDERARELGGEQQRWYDLKRTGKLLELVQKYNPDAKANIKDYHILRPIPQTQLDAVINKEEFKQNTGYSGN